MQTAETIKIIIAFHDGNGKGKSMPCYHHTAERGNPHYDIYFKFDHAAKTVTFALGGEKKVVPLEEYTGWSWKLTGTKLLCGTSFELEKTFLDEFWDVVPVNLGRKVLRIKDVI